MTTNREIQNNQIQNNKIQNKMIQKNFYVSLLVQVEPFKLVGRALNAQVNAVIAYPHLNAYNADRKLLSIMVNVMRIVQKALINQQIVV
jgi:hypothetical protein